MPRRINFSRPTRTQRVRSGRYRESLKARGIQYIPKRKK